jgi:hypothetical protein
MENWRDLPGFDGDYEVSDRGSIRRAKPSPYSSVGKVLKLRLDARGYHRVPIRRGNVSKLVSPHIAVLEAFVGPRPDKHDASHLNGIRTDNRLENLKWESSSDNHRRKLSHGTLIHGEKHKLAKLTHAAADEIRRRWAAGESGPRLAVEYGVSPATVWRVANGLAWMHAA